jgi:hypothetical protein
MTTKGASRAWETRRKKASVITQKPANDGHLKTGDARSPLLPWTPAEVWSR